MGSTLIFPLEFDVALCGITVKTAALSLSLVGHPCFTWLNPMKLAIFGKKYYFIKVF